MAGELKAADDRNENGEELLLGPQIRKWLKPLASLKLTVALFALAIFIVFVGTLAQTQKDIWVVVREYFRTPVAWIDFQVFFPKSFFPKMDPVGGYFPFPGGWLIGAAMAVNLLAAHLVRFTVQSSGKQLLAGVGIIGVGCVVTALVVAGGSGDGLQGVPFFKWSTLWLLVKIALLAISAAAAYGGITLDETHKTERRLLIGACIALGLTTIGLFVMGEKVALGDSSMRILWQLIQGTLAGVILLAGCWLVFKKRAGIVLLHAGVGLMMFSELLVGTSAVEAQLHVKEGDTVNYLQDIRAVELAVIDSSDAKNDTMTVIPQSRLLEGFQYLHHSTLPRWFVELFPVKVRKLLGCTNDEPVLKDEKLPFDVKVVRYLQSSRLRPITAEDKEDNPATKGIGTELFADSAVAGVGTDSGGAVDETAAYIELFKKGTDESLGTYLVSLLQSRLEDSRDRSGWTEAEQRSQIPPFLEKMSRPTVVEVDGKPYRLALRFKRTYKPYSMTLLDVRFDKYVGTETAKNYSSDVHLVDPTRNVDRADVHIWMNNPLRFAGETFYQSSVGSDPITGVETTGLQVVTNTGWMIPYVSCMIVGVGMLFQFGLTLMRFVRRRDSGRQMIQAGKAVHSAEMLLAGHLINKLNRPESTEPSATVSRSQSALLETLFVAGMVAFWAIYVFSHARMPGKSKEGFDLYVAGQLPVTYQGRVKPLDTLARNTLQIISDKETLVGVMTPVSLKENWEKIETKLKDKWKALGSEDLKGFAGHPERLDELADLIEKKTKAPRPEIEEFVYKVTSERQPAIRWLLDVISGDPMMEKHRVFRIENFDVMAKLGLKPRDGYRYALAEFRPKVEEFNEEVAKAQTKRKEKGADKLDLYERKLLDLDRRTRAFTAVAAAFRRSEFPKPTEEIRTLAKERRASLMKSLAATEEKMLEGHPPFAVPVTEAGGKLEWKPLVIASTSDYFLATVLQERKPDPAVAAWNGILTAYESGDSKSFNEDVRKYQEWLAEAHPPEYNAAKLRYESFFNQFAPFFQAWILYIAVFVLAALAWLGWSGPLNRAAFWLTAFTFLIHTFALASRIYISGRPPVTNLYSSAVFIGWGCVVAGLILERVFRLGIGNVIASVAGFATLFISFKLAGDGDTFTVMQAVLDTQFWLATHVTCITLGYATTFLSGLLGLIYIVRGVATPTLTPEIGKSLSRMVYGTLCFAIFFSFVGTVLGGLWADDSWGRFWGWDPKENGALIIVLWNALVLHARWDGMVKDRGLAVLAVGGNIVTGWSWFGVNELGVGLHSYGFTDGVLLSLGLFIVSQLAVIGTGCLPRDVWVSGRDRTAA